MTEQPRDRLGRWAETPRTEPRITSISPRLNVEIDPDNLVALQTFATHVQRRGGRAVIVGGTPRDTLLGLPPKDIDIEVLGCDVSDVEASIAETFGDRSANLVGASFGTYKVGDFDIAVARREEATGGGGHRDFEVSFDQEMDFAEASSRRDFTIGAMGVDPLTWELLDPHRGSEDLAKGILRHVGDQFVDDPLRALRGCRFAARFDMRFAPETVRLCEELADRADLLASERVWGELESTFKQASKPGVFLHAARQIGWLRAAYPHMADLDGCAQDPTHHPEGDVLTHTGHALDYWGQHLRTGNEDVDIIVATAIACHDLGKPSTTEVGPDGRLHAYGHEKAGADISDKMISGRFGRASLAASVRPLVEHHLAPLQMLRDDPSDKALRRLAVKVGRIDLAVAVAEADACGRPPIDNAHVSEGLRRLVERAGELGVDRNPPKRLASGDMLIEAGYTPGPAFRGWLDRVYEMELDGSVTTPEQARSALLQVAAES